MTEQSDPPIQFQVGEETWSLRMSFAAICQIERVFDKPFRVVATEVFGPDMKLDDFLTVFHACLLRENPHARTQAEAGIEDVTREEAGLAIEQIGMGRAGELIGKAIEQCPMFREQPAPPKPKVRGAGEGKPKKAAAA